MHWAFALRLLIWVCLSAGLCACNEHPAASTGSGIQPASASQRNYVHVDEVRPGMRGYGMTVFHGTEPKPFTVEVISVENGATAGKSVVWVRCPEPRMQLTGPVQGMSGSPIYLWTDRQNGTPGQGGRLLGAFAFGHSLGKDCYVGVQPIHQMLKAAERANEPADSSNGTAAPARADAGFAAQTLRTLDALAAELGPDQPGTARWKNIRSLFARSAGLSSDKPAQPAAADARKMALPLVGVPPSLQPMMGGILQPMGLQAVSASSSQPTLKPAWINPDQVVMKPGSTFTIPLTFGPLEMAVLGTATEVLDDGRVLAFGHQFFAQGPMQLPMASGFVHFIQPNLQASFKVGGPLKVLGTVVRDEATAVVGTSKKSFRLVPCTIDLDWDTPKRQQQMTYQIADHQRLLPMLVGAVASGSLTTDTQVPAPGTLHIKANMSFDNGRTLTLNQMLPGAGEREVLFALFQVLGPILNNSFGEVRLTEVKARLRVESRLRMAPIIGATLEQPSVKPGGKAVIHVDIQPHLSPVEHHRLELQIPPRLPAGKYPLSIGGAMAYQQQIFSSRPHLMLASSTDEMFDAMDQMLAIRDDQLYAVLRFQQPTGLAIGRSELPDLPSSRAALLFAESSTRTTPFAGSAETQLPVTCLVPNQVMLILEVQEDLPENP